eukprot:CAMPEP_0194119722 /NCGR_PEP_ID=MMETSP0150-20130528/40650_1 /TAXON_ID=122233 /ORGANISM="Chaetoceros debilis, Strain MM31A-1" /LENGTH=689 /DNA_ID=CAMNT_0038811533 /DNA_START=198 /DNA_END=2267 /DNA_ORIENTATION=-
MSLLACWLFFATANPIWKAAAIDLDQCPNTTKTSSYHDVCSKAARGELEGAFSLANDSASDYRAQGMSGEIDISNEIDKLIEDFLCEMEKSKNIYMMAMDEYCHNAIETKKGNESKLFEAQTQPQMCTPDSSATLDGLKIGLETAQSAVSVAKIAIDLTRDSGHAAAWGALVIALGAGTWLPSAAAYGIATGAVATQNTLLQAAKVVLVLYDTTISIIEFKSAADGCVYQTLKTTHDLSFEMFDEVEENRQILDFISCPYNSAFQTEGSVTLMRGGCNGIDDDCDSITTGAGELRYLVDECDEDKVPPTISMASFASEQPVFKTEQEMKDWFLENSETSDDCSTDLKKEIFSAIQRPAPDEDIWDVTLRVFDDRCASQPMVPDPLDDTKQINGPGEFEGFNTFQAKVDGAGPEVICEFRRPQDINHILSPPVGFTPDGSTIPPFPANGEPLYIDYANELKRLVNVNLWYSVEDSGSNTDVVEIEVIVRSNEFEFGGNREMLTVVERQDVGPGLPLPVHRADIYLAPFTCHSTETADKRKEVVCNVEPSDSMKSFTTRFYDIEIIATDLSGNEGSATCSVIVATEHYPLKKKSKKGAGELASLSRGFNSRRRRNKTSSTGQFRGGGKGGPKPPRPTANELLNEYVVSTRRYKIGSYKLQWDPTLNSADLPTQPPTMAPTRIGKKAKGSSP